MKLKFLFLLGLPLLFIGCMNQVQALEQESSLNSFIENSYQSKKIDEHTCRRVKSFGANIISKKECMQFTKIANSICENIAKEQVKINPSVQGEKIARTVMVCPIAKILNYKTHIIENDMKIELPSEQALQRVSQVSNEIAKILNLSFGDFRNKMNNFAGDNLDVSIAKLILRRQLLKMAYDDLNQRVLPDPTIYKTKLIKYKNINIKDSILAINEEFSLIEENQNWKVYTQGVLFNSQLLAINHSRNISYSNVVHKLKEIKNLTVENEQYNQFQILTLNYKDEYISNRDDKTYFLIDKNLLILMNTVNKDEIYEIINSYVKT